jgi:hypothetical protein
VINQDVGKYLTRNNPTTAEQWHYARIQAASKKVAAQLLSQIAKNRNPQTEFAALAKTKSADTATNTKGGDVGWVRASDTTLDTLMSPTLVQALKAMGKSHTVFQLYNSGATWYILEYVGHDLKHALGASQIQQDQTDAVNKWGSPLVAKAVFNPPLAQSAVTSPSTQATAVPVQPTSPPATAKPTSGKKK